MRYIKHSWGGGGLKENKETNDKKEGRRDRPHGHRYTKGVSVARLTHFINPLPLCEGNHRGGNLTVKECARTTCTSQANCITKDFPIKGSLISLRMFPFAQSILLCDELSSSKLFHRTREVAECFNEDGY